MQIITLLTDFGTQDYFVGAMKGVILSINPSVRIVDITHDVPAQDIEAAAFSLLACYRDFPAGTIHVAVVDPGVGSNRRALAIECARQIFVGPDNGIFSWICEREGSSRAIHLNNEAFFRHPVSKTFHGRDIFAPVAAALSTGVAMTELGEKLIEYARLDPLLAAVRSDGRVEGRVIHIDRFGNCITNLTPAHFSSDQAAARRCGRARHRRRRRRVTRSARRRVPRRARLRARCDRSRRRSSKRGRHRSSSARRCRGNRPDLELPVRSSCGRPRP